MSLLHFSIAKHVQIMLEEIAKILTKFSYKKSSVKKCLTNVSETLGKVLLFQKSMSACDCSPQEMSRVIRILNELVRSQAPTPLICRMIQVTHYIIIIYRKYKLNVKESTFYTRTYRVTRFHRFRNHRSQKYQWRNHRKAYFISSQNY